tara:strand:+ start:583 stop:732 length:150 start_codon:yes stop_codon:yes gene_type:complete
MIIFAGFMDFADFCIFTRRSVGSAFMHAPSSMREDKEQGRGKKSHMTEN